MRAVERTAIIIRFNPVVVQCMIDEIESLVISARPRESGDPVLGPEFPLEPVLGPTEGWTRVRE
jgi:hypothetical protein